MALSLVQSIEKVRNMGRRSRRPRHTFQLRHRPWVIQPFMIAPVLAGETLENGFLQSRAVSDPIKNPLIGWWIEYFMFYVKLRDLEAREEIETMILDPNWSNDNIDDTTANVPTYHAGGADGIDWSTKCLEAVTKHYFRNEGETWNSPLLDTLPQAKVRHPQDNNWMDSLVNYAEIAGAEDESLTVGVDDVVTGREVEDLMRRWEQARYANLTEMTFEDYLATFGIRGAQAEELHVPELLRWVRDWTYPTNHIDPTDGSPTSAVSWSVSERIDKNRFFKEPGFVFGVTVARPKVYMRNQLGSATWLLNDAKSWLPAMLSDDPMSSLKHVPDTAGTNGPLSVNVTDADGYWVDVRDLFLYGDQFVNFAMSATDAGMVSLPTAALDKDYVSEVDMEAMFVTAASEYVKQDGVVSLNIMGTQMDHTPGRSVQGVQV